jgi:hypothetical protein
LNDLQIAAKDFLDQELSGTEAGVTGCECCVRRLEQVDRGRLVNQQELAFVFLQQAWEFVFVELYVLLE